jgi:hypothetical protein
MQMKENICLTGMLLLKTHGCIATNPNRSVFQCNGNIETEVRKRLGEQSKDFYVAGFGALLKRWDKCINVGGEYLKKTDVFPRFEYNIFYILYPLVTYLLSPTKE